MSESAATVQRSAVAAVQLEDSMMRRQQDSVWRHFAKNRLAVIALLVLAVFSIVPLVAPLFLDEQRVTQQSLRQTFQAPSADAWFGRDELGRDAFARAIYGAR